MHKCHHRDADELRLELVAQLALVVCVHGRGDGAVWLAGADGGGFGVFEDFHVWLCGVVWC